jgi:serine/threonine-protein kinase HipA
MSKRGKVFIGETFAGIIEQKDGLFIFKYDTEYLNKPDPLPLSLTLPLSAQAYEQKTMIPFFDGLIPEGWLLNIIEGNWKINPRDRMSLLLLACRDSIGNVSVVDDSPKDEK